VQADQPIDFAHDVAPILQKRCAKCHTGTQKKGGLSINTRQALLTGGDSGPAVVIRKSAESELIERVTSGDVDVRMPPEGERLTRDQIDMLRRWIDLDLPWEEGFAFGKTTRQAPLPPRRPPVPAGPALNALSNPIDRFLHGYFSEHKFSATELVSDRVFARRVSFDLIGLPGSDHAASARINQRQIARRIPAARRGVVAGAANFRRHISRQPDLPNGVESCAERRRNAAGCRDRRYASGPGRHRGLAVVTLHAAGISTGAVAPRVKMATKFMLTSAAVFTNGW
jgi:hypothetical protein